MLPTSIVGGGYEAVAKRWQQDTMGLEEALRWPVSTTTRTVDCVPTNGEPW